jgi:endonuclease-3
MARKTIGKTARKTVKKRVGTRIKKRLQAARKGKAARVKPVKAQTKADTKAFHGALPQWTKAEIEEAFRRFAAANPNPNTELEHGDPFTLLVSVVLSAQATDAGVNKATPALFALADTPEKMVKLGEAKVRELIKTIGLFRTKAKNVIALSRKLIEEHGGKVPHDRAALEALPGVGRKTANVVLNVAFGEPTIAVDTHIFRVGNRTGLAVGKTPLDVEMKLMEVVPEKYLMHAHHWLILHGRYTCVARRPLCEKCIIADLCKWPGKTVSSPPESNRSGTAPIEKSSAKKVSGVARRHHYVPKCYLKSFSIETAGEMDPRLYVFDAVERKSFRTRSKNVALERDFNTIDLEGHEPDAFEKAMATVESEIGHGIGSYR